jgi:hypothetical protein
MDFATPTALSPQTAAAPSNGLSGSNEAGNLMQQPNPAVVSPPGTSAQSVTGAAIAKFDGSTRLAERPDTGSVAYKTMARDLNRYLNTVVGDELGSRVIRPGYTYKPASYEELQSNIAVISDTLREKYGTFSENEFLQNVRRIGMTAGFNFGIHTDPVD